LNPTFGGTAAASTSVGPVVFKVAQL
jgi:hypothetical protein